MRSGSSSSNVAPVPVSVILCRGIQGYLRIRDALHHRVGIVEAADVDETWRTLEQHPAARLVILPSRDVTGRSVVDAVRNIRDSYPRVGIAAYTRASAEESAGICDLVTAGVHSLLFPDTMDSIASLRDALVAAEGATASEGVLKAMRPVIPVSLERFATICITRPQHSRRVSDIAATLGMHRKTLYNRCRAFAPEFGPEEMISWCRVLLAAYLLDGHGRTVESVATELDFASVTALRNLLRRYVGMSATTLRQSGGFRVALDAFAERTRAPAAIV